MCEEKEVKLQSNLLSKRQTLYKKDLTNKILLLTKITPKYINGLNEIITNDKIAKPNKVMNICLSLGLFNMPNNIYAIIFIFLKLFL